MKAYIDRFEGDYIVLETETQGMKNIPRANAPDALREGMVVHYEEDRIVAVDLEETARLEDQARRRFERILKRSKKQ